MSKVMLLSVAVILLWLFVIKGVKFFNKKDSNKELDVSAGVRA